MPVAQQPRAWRLESVGDIFRLSREAFGHFREPVWYRGHSVADWALLPKVCRPAIRGKTPRAKYEQAMAIHFKRFAPLRAASIPGELDFAGWIALMQHHGLPTRALDWTESALVASYFATTARSHLKQDAVVWVLAPRALNRAFLGQDVILTASDDYGRMATMLPLVSVPPDQGDASELAALLASGVVSFEPTEVHLRMLVQQSRFTLHGSDTDLREHARAHEFLGRIEIPSALKVQIAQSLASAGIRRSTVFPDLDNLSGELQDESTFEVDDLESLS